MHNGPPACYECTSTLPDTEILNSSVSMSIKPLFSPFHQYWYIMCTLSCQNLVL